MATEVVIRRTFVDSDYLRAQGFSHTVVLDAATGRITADEYNFLSGEKLVRRRASATTLHFPHQSTDPDYALSHSDFVEVDGRVVLQGYYDETTPFRSVVTPEGLESTPNQLLSHPSGEQVVFTATSSHT